MPTVEGDATLFMNQWALENLPLDDPLASTTTTAQILYGVQANSGEAPGGLGRRAGDRVGRR